MPATTDDALATASAASKLYRLDRPPPSSPRRSDRRRPTRRSRCSRPRYDRRPSPRAPAARPAARTGDRRRGDPQSDPPHPPRYPSSAPPCPASFWRRGGSGCRSSCRPTSHRPRNARRGRTNAHRLGSTTFASARSVAVVAAGHVDAPQPSVSTNDCPALMKKSPSCLRTSTPRGFARPRVRHLRHRPRVDTVDLLARVPLHGERDACAVA